MSILVNAEPIDPRIFLQLGIWAGISLLLAWGVGVFRRRSIEGPPRLSDQKPIGPLFIVFLVGGLVWFGLQILFFAWKEFHWSQGGGAGQFDISKLTPADYAFLATAPGIVGFLILIVGDAMVKNQTGQQLGYGLKKLPGGILRGVIGILIIGPLMAVSLVAIQLLYQYLQYEHPQEHDLLRVLNQTESRSHFQLLLAGAAVVAPVFEEMLFRGHLQTLFRRLLKSPWPAVFLTSIVFTIVHDPWTWPAIFILSLCLGYAYERTGNLWVPIVIHCLFNTINSIVYLYGPQVH